MNYASVIERYFQRRYFLDAGGHAGEDLCLMFHSNKVCLLTLAPFHPILLEKKTVIGVDFKVTPKVDRMQNKVSGRSKRGGQYLQEKSPVCIVKCSDESQYVVRGCINSKLLESNCRLIEEPALLSLSPENEGYIAVLMPGLKNDLSVLKNEEEYGETRKVKIDELKGDCASKSTSSDAMSDPGRALCLA